MNIMLINWKEISDYRQNDIDCHYVSSISEKVRFVKFIFMMPAFMLHKQTQRLGTCLTLSLYPPRLHFIKN